MQYLRMFKETRWYIIRPYKNEFLKWYTLWNKCIKYEEIVSVLFIANFLVNTDWALISFEHNSYI